MKNLFEVVLSIVLNALTIIENMKQSNLLSFLKNKTHSIQTIISD
jgi:hypothetical protein